MTFSAPVLLLHGLYNDSCQMSSLKECLESEGFETHSIDLKPPYGEVSIRELSDQVMKYTLAHMPGDFSIVGFSMGALVARYFLQFQGGIEKVKKVAFISSPHWGTLAAYFRNEPGVKEMRPRSPFLRELNEGIDTLLQLEILTLWTPLDCIIIPPLSSVIGIGTQKMIPCLDHTRMVDDKRVHSAILSLLKG